MDYHQFRNISHNSIQKKVYKIVLNAFMSYWDSCTCHFNCFSDTARNEMTTLGGEYREKCYNFVSEYDEESSTLQSDGKSVASMLTTFCWYNFYHLPIHQFETTSLYYICEMC